MLEIRPLTAENLPPLYHQSFINDFAHAELLRPLDRMNGLVEKKKYIACGFYQNGKLSAYTFLAKEADVLFLDFFAVMQGMRGGGIGSEVLELLKEKFVGASIVIEVENPKFATDAEDLDVRKKRIRFYQKNGFCIEGTELTLFGDQYLIMTCGYRGTKPELRETLDRIYTDLYTKNVYLENIKFLNTATEFQKDTDNK